MNLSEFTTFHLGGPAPDLTIARSRDDLIAFAEANGLAPGDRSMPDILLIGGGSNLLVSDAGFAGPVGVVATTGVTFTEISDTEMQVTAEAGESWDDFVAATLSSGLSGLEALSGIPGSVGATPIQNVGAYGTEVAELITSVEVYDRLSGQVRRLTAAELEFGYRTSALKRAARAAGTPAHIVLSVTFALPRGTDSLPVRYAQLAGALDVAIGTRVPALRVREAVLDLRRSKGMVLDEDDHDTWSAGSFFTNPIVESPEALAALPAEAPRFPVTDPLSGATIPGLTKTSAAWLIERAGFGKGYGFNDRARLSTKHTLALTNRGGATTSDVVDLARTIVAGVNERFGIVLEPEPTFIGTEL